MAMTDAGAQVTARQSSASFGRFGADCSSGRGVCSFNVQQVAATPASSQSAEKTSANTFVVRIKRSEISSPDELKIAGKSFSQIGASERPTFEQSDPVTLDKATLANLGFPSTMNRIPAGNYPISIYTDHVEVTFTVEP